jgi:hypothetical protein
MIVNEYAYTVVCTPRHKLKWRNYAFIPVLHLSDNSSICQMNYKDRHQFLWTLYLYRLGIPRNNYKFIREHLWFTAFDYPFGIFKLLSISKLLNKPPVFSGIRVTWSLVLCVCFVDRCLSFCHFSFGHCVICSSISGFSLPRRYLQTLPNYIFNYVLFHKQISQRSHHILFIRQIENNLFM